MPTAEADTIGHPLVISAGASSTAVLLIMFSYQLKDIVDN
jgi:hypothetical protein